MKEIKSIVYVTDDGKEFTNKQEATQYEARLNNVKYFVVHYCPDLTEGRGLQKAGIVMVHANGSHRDFVEHWCYKKFGNRIDFCMGVYGSNAITVCWSIREVTETELGTYDVLNKIEEQFVEKIWM